MSRTFLSMAARARMALCCGLVCVLCAPAAADDISHFFKTTCVTWMLLHARDDETDMLEWSYELEPGDLPVEVELVRAKARKTADGDEEDEEEQDAAPAGDPVLETVRFAYPDDTLPEQRITYVEIRARSGAKTDPFRTLYRGPVDASDPQPQITVGPYMAQALRIRFLGAAGDAAVIPRLELHGIPNVAARAAPLDPDSLERSYVAFWGGQPVGRFSWKRQAQEQGFVYITKAIFKMKILNLELFSEEDEEDEEIDEDDAGAGKTREELCTIYTTSDLQLTSLDCDYPSTDSGAHADVTDDKLNLMRTGVGEFRKNKTKNLKNYDDGVEVLFDAYLYDRLAAVGLTNGLVRRFVILNPISGDLIQVTARVLEFYPAHEGRADLYVVLVTADDKKYDYTRVALVESDGEVLREFDYEGDYEWWSVEDPEDWELVQLILDSDRLLEYLREQLHNIIPLPDSVEWARVAIRWNEVPPEFLKLEGPRQSLVSLEQPEPGVYEAELEIIKRRPGEEPFVASEPLSDAELAPYLLYDETIDTQDQNLVELADKIAGLETDPLEISRLVFNWLVRNMRPEDIHEYYVLPASEILKKRRGDCKHFAVLFATLARIKGVPTRFVFGQRYIGGSYGYHVWNQVYVDGEWLDVDASDLAFVPGALHIQLDTAATFNEKGHSGALMGFRPDPEILETVEGDPDYSALRGRVPTEFAASHFQDAFFNFRIDYPESLSHQVMDLGFIRKITFSLPDQPQFIASIYVIPVYGDAKDALMFQGVGQQETLHMLDLFGSLKHAHYGKQGTTEFGGGEGFYFLGSFRNEDKELFKFDLTILVLEDRIFIFHYAAQADVFGDYNRQVGFIKKSLQTF